MARADVCVVVPAYNEAGVLSRVLEELSELPYRIIVIDDGSADETAEVASRFDVVLLRHIWNLGQGASLQTGINYALGLPETTCVVTFDADGQHHVDDVTRLVETLEGSDVDLVLGTRFAQGADTPGISTSRRVALKAATAFTRFSTGLSVTDTHNGMRAMTASAARRLTISQNRMAHASEILANIASLGLRHREIPVTVRYTEYSAIKGQSNLQAVMILWDIATSKLR